MPRRITSRVVQRKSEVYDFLRKRGETTTIVLVKELGLTHSQAFYALRLLSRRGLVREIKRGKIAYWKVLERE